MELFQAHAQWAKRPADEQFNSINDMYWAARKYADASYERDGVEFSTLRAEAQDGDVVLVGKGNVPAKLTYWAFGQLSQRAEAPATYLRSLPATLATQNINHGLKHRQEQDGKANMLFHKNGNFVCRSITGEKYERIWNYEVAERLLDLEQQGWEPARPDIRVKNDNATLYVSDHDMFAFLRMRNTAFENPVKSAAGERAPIYKGLIAGNSEVGGGSIWYMRFFYNEMCGNHIIWGASEVREFRARHVGSVREWTQSWAVELRAYADESTAADEAGIRKAVNMKIAATKDELLDTLFGKRSLGLSRKAIAASYDAALPEQDGSPLTVWGWVQGATRHSQTIPYQDQRMQLDRAAAKVLSMAF